MMQMNQRSQYNPQPSELHPYQPIIPSPQQQIISSPQQQSYEPSVVQQHSHASSTKLDSGFIVPSFLPTVDPKDSLNKAIMFLSTAINSIFPLKNNQLKTSSNSKLKQLFKTAELQFRMCKDNSLGVMGLTHERCTVKKRVKGLEWLKEKMLLVQAQEAGVILQEEQQDFLADGLEDLDSDCDDLQVYTTLIFKAYHVDAFDLDCDEAPMASAIFMARLSPSGSVNGDNVSTTYDSDILYEIVEIVLWYLDSGGSKHMNGQHDKLIKFLSKFIGTVRFKNDHFAAIIGYGDLLIGNIFISRSKKESHKPKSEPITNERLQMLHMDACGPMTKDETPEVIIKFLKQAQVSLRQLQELHNRTGSLKGGIGL
ncbi:hypothetical protein Tco_0116863 [Tanacetum coccineum]